jgi:hypothetical protein
MTGACVRYHFGLAGICLCAVLGVALAAEAQEPVAAPVEKDAAMSHHAQGTFDVTTKPLAADEALEGTPVGRYALVKQYHGDLDAAAKGEMLGAGNLAKGVAGYVAIEHVKGTLQSHRGSFALQHNATMDSGKFNMAITVVPGSGEGDLAGIAGTLTIIIADGKHSYTFDYTLPEKQ